MNAKQRLSLKLRELIFDNKAILWSDPELPTHFNFMYITYTKRH